MRKCSVSCCHCQTLTNNQVAIPLRLESGIKAYCCSIECEASITYEERLKLESFYWLLKTLGHLSKASRTNLWNKTIELNLEQYQQLNRVMKSRFEDFQNQLNRVDFQHKNAKISYLFAMLKDDLKVQPIKHEVALSTTQSVIKRRCDLSNFLD